MGCCVRDFGILGGRVVVASYVGFVLFVGVGGWGGKMGGATRHPPKY